MPDTKSIKQIRPSNSNRYVTASGQPLYGSGMNEGTLPAQAVVPLEGGGGVQQEEPPQRQRPGVRMKWVCRSREPCFLEQPSNRLYGPPTEKLTSYARDYPAQPNSQRRLMKPKEGFMGDGPFYGRTTTGESYKPHYGYRPIRRCKEPEWSPNKAKLDAITSYESTYAGIAGKPAISQKPPVYLSNPDKFTGEATYLSDYTPKPLNYHRRTNPDLIYYPMPLPTGTTHYEHEYHPHDEKPRENMAPRHYCTGGGKPMPELTSYRHNYIPKENGRVTYRKL